MMRKTKSNLSSLVAGRRSAITGLETHDLCSSTSFVKLIQCFKSSQSFQKLIMEVWHWFSGLVPPIPMPHLHIVPRYGDPNTKHTQEDAKQCVKIWPFRRLLWLTQLQSIWLFWSRLNLRKSRFSLLLHRLVYCVSPNKRG